MFEEQVHPSRRTTQQKFSESDLDTNFLDEVRFFYAHRAKLAVYFSAVFFTGFIGLAAWRLSRPLKVEGRVILNFKGIEKGEYPDGRKFSIEDLRSHDIVTQALLDAKVVGDQAAANKIVLDVNVQPVIPSFMEKRWARQDKEGGRREEYFPNEFKYSINWTDLPRDGGERFFEALVSRYKERAKLAQLSTLQVGRGLAQENFYKNLLKDPNYDYDDIQRVLVLGADTLSKYVNQLLLSDSNSVLQMGLKDVQAEIAVWSSTHLEVLKAMTAGSSIVKNKETIAARLRYRLSNSNALIQQKVGEEAEALKLLAAVQKPQPLLIGQSEKGSATPADSAAIERLMASNYIAPLVRRISDLQSETKKLEVEKNQTEKEIGAIVQARVVTPENLPATYRNVLMAASAELQRIIDKYNTVVDQYLTLTTANYINIAESPMLVREGHGMSKLLVMLFMLSAGVAIALVRLGAVLRNHSGGQ